MPDLKRQMRLTPRHVAYLQPETVVRLLLSAPDNALHAHRVGVRVNRLAHDDVACLAEVAPPVEQLGLGL